MIRCIEERSDGIRVYEMENDDLKVIVTSYGVTLMEIDMKGRDGSLENVILGYPGVEDYMAKSGTYFGALVGRTCNRLAKGAFRLNGKDYSLAINNGPNNLHGGLEGFSYKNFASRIVDDNTLVFTYKSAAGEEGYPGNLELKATLQLSGNELKISYDALSDEDTLCSLTQHTYFNLNQNGETVDVSDHLLQINADRHGLVDADGLCMGKFREVEGTPLDFRTPALISQGYDMEDWQVKNAFGIDHHFVLEEGSPALILSDPASGRILEVETTSPGIQLYSGNYIEPCKGRNGRTYGQHAGLAIEPQILPDSIHVQEHPEALLKANQPYHQEILYRFKTAGKE